MMLDMTDARRQDEVELVQAAQAGVVAAVSLLLERHWAGMRAVALSILGPGPDVDDVMQEAALVALRRITDVRDPQAVGPWLRMIVRNRCRGLLREARRLEPVADVPLPGTGGDLSAVLERQALGDWVWEAIEALSPALRLPLVLRHFTDGVMAYESIARVCGVPVGTVRSRLSQARAKLVAALDATAADAHSDSRSRTAAGWEAARATLAAAESGEFGKILRQDWSPEVALLSADVPVGGAALLVRAMDGDLEAGVRQRPVNVVAGRSVAVWEMDLINPADDPDHCPPSVAWIMGLEDGRVARLRLFHPRPLPASAIPPDLQDVWPQ
ncbi:RNA polymerase sigma factor [Actinomadura decatromicini]|uniref:Sigma-70 family RNA polymerase sigma factor n=1 Tax=Actinomadura decatromicini TaxID=2604572 RepID=A0A5D3FYE0_9ACTN|nr:sigma-70 family RNA polymerase sigma factor [Actinomadura decatromicini]TYK53029.1 sigma-70 family RNA polymerase sigma factor [Actinomadura decatromicini]